MAAALPVLVAALPAGLSGAVHAAPAGEAANAPRSQGLYQCRGPNGGTVFRSTRQDGCIVLASPDPAAPDPQRWVPLMGMNGVISYLDQRSVRRRGTQVGVVLMRNSPSGVIQTANGEPIRSSLRRMVLDCSTSMYAVVDQTLYSKRFARGEPLYTIAGRRQPQPAAAGTIAGEVIERMCRSYPEG
ncbi:hypothetical protein K6V06_03215 [Cupriavidus sp. AU9028]|nr:hypothetical protein [Cupriavidus sp. AU9028]